MSKYPEKIWKYSKVFDPNPTLQRNYLKSLFSLTRFVDWLSLWAQLFLLCPLKYQPITVPSALSLPACRFLLNTEGRWPYFTLNQAEQSKCRIAIRH
jgi:hypothetical protein